MKMFLLVHKRMFFLIIFIMRCAHALQDGNRSPTDTGIYGTSPYGPLPSRPTTMDPHDSKSSYRPHTFGPNTIGWDDTTTRYGPLSYRPPSVGPHDAKATNGNGPPSFGPPTNGSNGPPSFGYQAPDDMFNHDSNNEVINYTTSTNWTNEYDTDETSSWMNNPILFAENFDLVSYIKTVCPETNSCAANETGSSYQPSNCCVQCDCSDDCFAMGTCCYDKEVPDYSNVDKISSPSLEMSCVFPTYGLSDAQLLRNLNKKSVLMINNCYKDEEGLSVEDRTFALSCKNLNNFKCNSVLDLVPVYSPALAVSFSNAICAKCNAHNLILIPWNFTTLSCPTLKSFSDLFMLSGIDSFLQILETSNCILEFHAPNNNSVECLHEKSVISDCAEEAMELFHPKIREYCKNVTILFGKGNKMYKNIFCYGCNAFSQEMNQHSCSGNSQGFGYDFGNIEAEIGLSTLEGLLVESFNKSDEITEATCENGFIHHKYLNQCIAYTCAPSKVNVSGQCIPVLKKLKNIGLAYIVKYRFMVGSSDSNKYEYLSETIHMVHGNTNAALCRQDIKATASLKDFHVTYDIFLTRLVAEMTNIEKEFQYFKQRYNASVRRRGKVEIILGHEGYVAMKFGQFGFVRYEGLENEFMCPETVAMVDLQFCDAVAIRINKDDVDTANLLQINSMKFKQSEYLLLVKTKEGLEQMYAQICRDLFESKLQTLIEHRSDGDDNAVSGTDELCSSMVFASISLLLCLVFPV